jgi:hypothetical protein
MNTRRGGSSLQSVRVGEQSSRVAAAVDAGRQAYKAPATETAATTKSEPDVPRARGLI